MSCRDRISRRLGDSLKPEARSPKPDGFFIAIALIVIAAAAACREAPPADRLRVSGYVEASDVRIAPEVGGRVVELLAMEGARVTAGDVVARLDTTDTRLAMNRLEADRQQAQAQLRLLQAGSRVEDIRQADAHVASLDSEIATARAELASAEADLGRFESLVQANAGSIKQRDDAATRRQMAASRVRAAEERRRGAQAGLARVKAGARREELDAARARVASVDAQMAVLQKTLADAVVRSPLTGIVIEKLVDVGELVAPRTPLLLVADLDTPWANVFIDERDVPKLKLGQAATVFTDAGGSGLPGTVTFISSRAEFTPRNVQTADERAKLVYRAKVTVKNPEGVLKQGMPVEVELPVQPAAPGAP